jgi:hypothetical protein
VVEVPDEGQNIALEAVDQSLERSGLGGGRLVDPGGQIGTRRRRKNALTAKGRDPFHEPVHDQVAHPPHRLAVQGEWIVIRR